MTTRHVPVMTAEVLRYLVHSNARTVVDATVGAGGHADAILSKHESLNLIGIDRDPAALAQGGARLARFGGRYTGVQASFAELARVLGGIGPVDGILADLGVSSMQLDDDERGFSHRADAPLDMRMGEGGETAAEFIARSDAESLARVLKRFGEVHRPRSLAAAIERAAREGRMETTGDLRRTVESTLGGAVSTGLLSRVFQAFRIAVNGELEQLEALLAAALEWSRPDGRIVVLSYHSLEDRMVKNFMRAEAAGCVCPPDVPVCVCGRVPRVEVLTRRVVKPGPDEVSDNPRSRSARLRAARVIGAGGGQ
jgi:16S rRNA (cytosine1402-N4)-methyltransferase